MRRRAFLAALGGAVAWSSAAGAQPSGRTRVIGLMMLNAEGDREGLERVDSFRRALQGLGWNDGSNVRLDVRWYGGDHERAKTHARDLVEQPADVIVANGTLGLAAAQQLTKTVPIVFLVVTDPVGAGFVQSLSQPGGNITGFSTFEPEMGGKWIETLLEIAPHVKRVAALIDPEFRGFSDIWRAIEILAPSFGLEAVALHARSGPEIEQVIRTFARHPDSGLIVSPTSTNAAHRKLIFSVTSETRLPAIYPFSYYARQGGLMSYGFDAADLFKRAAPYVARILEGEWPGQLPVQAPTKFELVVNGKTAKALGLTVPPSLLARADEVIE
jgi:putative tryptophan/tyrosine transport system substrate-binding protein